jgi:hypothetical protein
MFENIKIMEDNVLASSHLIHNSMNELNRSLNAAHVTLHNSINAFNGLKFNKFIENVVADQSNIDINMLDNDDIATNVTIGDMKSEDDKLGFALEIALHEISKEKKGDKD